MYIFGYGSLMNEKSLAKTLPGKRETRRAMLKNYQRKMNGPGGKYLSLNIIPAKDVRVEGVLVKITPDELALLKKREWDYECVEVSESISPKVKPVFAFIAPDLQHPTGAIPRSYIETCLRGVAEPARAAWLAETIIENPILEDLEAPVYENAALGD